MSKVVLDASALLALIKNEKGSVKVEQTLGNIVMSSVNVSEVASKLLDSGIPEEECMAMIEPFVSCIISFDDDQIFLTATLKKFTKQQGLSLGDRACIALGIQLSVPIYTADKAWLECNIPNAEIVLIR
jgi:PIN domain nuclease of toxin-antitoxin system